MAKYSLGSCIIEEVMMRYMLVTKQTYEQYIVNAKNTLREWVRDWMNRICVIWKTQSLVYIQFTFIYFCFASLKAIEWIPVWTAAFSAFYII